MKKFSLKTKSFILFPITLIFCFKILFTQITYPTKNYVEVDPKAKEILDKISEKNKNLNSAYVEFGIILENKQNNTKDSQKGYLWLKKNKLKIDLANITIYSDGETQWTYNKNSKEITISYIDSSENNIFVLDNLLKLYEKNFKIRFIRERFEKNRALYEIELYPKNLKETDFTKINLKIDKDKMQIFSLKKFGKDGTDFYLELIKIIPNINIQDSIITFDKNKYKDIEIIDLRD